MLVQTLKIIAEFERKILIDRITSGLERKAARGQRAGGVPPYGYHVDPDTHRLTENPDEAAILREIFQQYVSARTGIRALATALNQRGLRTRAGRLWSGHTIVGMLTNRVYLGELNYRTISVPHAHPPLITTDQYSNAQRTLAVHGHLDHYPPQPGPSTT